MRAIVLGILLAGALLLSGAAAGAAPALRPGALSPPPLNLSLSGSGAILLGAPAALWANGTGGWPPYHFTWLVNTTPVTSNVSYPTGSSSRLDLRPLGDGIYTLVVVLNDSHGNSTSQRTLLSVTGPSPVTVSLAVGNGTADGGFTVSAEARGGTPPYRYLWEAPGAPSGFTNLSRLVIPPGGSGTVDLSVTARDHLGFTGAGSLTVHRSVGSPSSGLSPWVLLGLGAGAAFVATLAVVYVLARRRRPPPPAAPVPPP